MQPMLVSYPSCYFSSLQRNIGKVSKILTSVNKFEVVFILYQPESQLSPDFQVDIVICEDNWANRETGFSPVMYNKLKYASSHI